MVLPIEDFPCKGLYLLFSDSRRLMLDHQTIEEYSDRFLKDPAKVPLEVKKAVEFQPCPICPIKESGEFCHALRPVLPFWEAADRYASCDRVTVVYRGDEEVLHWTEASMQEALRYISLLSLMYYCEKGRLYWKYFFGVTPLMPSREVAARVYMNMYWQKGGDREAVNDLIEKFRIEITTTCDCQIRRLRLICRKDSFVNAFVKTQILGEMLALDMERTLERTVQDYDSKPTP